MKNVGRRGSDGEDNLEPGREGVDMFEEEGGDGVSIVRSVVLSLAHSINNNDSKTKS